MTNLFGAILPISSSTTSKATMEKFNSTKEPVLSMYFREQRLHLLKGKKSVLTKYHCFSLRQRIKENIVRFVKKSWSVRQSETKLELESFTFWVAVRFVRLFNFRSTFLTNT